MTVAFRRFSKQLRKLEEYNRGKINKMVQFAHRCTVKEVQEVVRLVSRFIRKQPFPTKMCGVHVLDSIMKYNSTLTAEFRRQFAVCIIGLFLMAFMKAETQDRKRLFLFRSSWQWILPTDRLYYLDMTTRQFDPDWLVIEPICDENMRPGGSNDHVPIQKRVRFQLGD
uniref:Uncharacterized protein n=1 Tax=Panagrellus redivivus TaxID=6233 RepID=A0A7E4V014_PANRE